MPKAQRQDDNSYRIGVWGKLPGASSRVRVLAEAVVPPETPAPAADDATNTADGLDAEDDAGVRVASAFGWVAGMLPSPSKGDRYLVEFSGPDTFRILAYADPFGRAFTVDAPITVPPARTPDVAFVPDSDAAASGEDSFAASGAPDKGDEAGVVEVLASDGGVVHPAEYYRVGGRYSFGQSWHKFGDHGENLTAADALARAYFAFVYRPKRFGTPLFEHGLEPLVRLLGDDDVGAALAGVVERVQSAELDQGMSAPPLGRCLAHWLVNAGVASVAPAIGRAPVNLRLARTARYADTLYLADDDGTSVPRRTVWALEAALNRSLLVYERLGEGAATASEAQVCAADTAIIEGIGTQAPDAAHPNLAYACGEWDVRVALASAIERLRLPFRIEAQFRMDVYAGAVALSATVPDAQLMPRSVWEDGESGWVAVPDASRVAASTRYSSRVAILLAAAAFSSSGDIHRVSVTLTPLSDDVAEPAGLSSPFAAFEVGFTRPGATAADFAEPGGASSVTVLFDRRRFCDNDAYRGALADDPVAFLRSFDARLVDAGSYDPFAIVRALPSSGMRLNAPEVGARRLSAESRAALGAAATEDLRIFDKAERRRVAEGLAGRIAHTATAAEGVAVVRAAQHATGDPLVHEGCTRLMAALAEGSVDTTDQNAVVNAFMGEDRYLSALNKARGVVGTAPLDAIEILKGAIAEAEADGRFADSTEVVHRVFDSYTARVVYNLARQGKLPWAGEGARLSDAGSDANVELVPDSLYACCLDLVNLMERVPNRASEAIGYGQRCMRMAPTIAAGYRQTARAYMIAGMPHEARTVLTDCLRIAVRPEDASVAYYQIAFVEWNMGHFPAAIAAYLKSLDVSSAVAPQAMMELRRLMDEHDVPLPARDEIDPALVAAGVPVIPADELVDVLDHGVEAAANDGMFPVAHNLLSLRLRYRPDDALANAALSLT